jgi:RNA polymerase sigma-70 factor (ECF subfamily)
MASRCYEDRLVALLEDYRPGLLRMARKICGQGGIDPEDLVQEALNRALLHREKLSPDAPGACRVWLTTTVSNLFLDACRRRRSEQTAFQGWSAEAEVVPAVTADPDSIRWWLAAESHLRLAVAELSPELREVVMMFYGPERLPHTEIAERLNIARGTVGSRLFQARKALREIVRRKVTHALGEDLLDESWRIWE